MKGAKIRRAKPSDITDVLEIERQCFSKSEAFNRRQLRMLLRNPNAAVLVIVVAGRIVAWSVALVRRHASGCSGRIYSIAVLPSARNQGIGESLLRRSIKCLKERRARRIYLEVRSDNSAAIALYIKMRFERVCEISDYYAKRIHATRMRLG